MARITITVDGDDRVDAEVLRTAAVDAGFPDVAVTVTRNPRVFVSDDRRRLVRLWASGEAEYAERANPGHVWGPPTHLFEEVNS